MRGQLEKVEKDPSTTQHLIQKDLDAGFVFEVTGGLENAKARWGANVAVGKLNLALAEGKDPRLVLGSSIPNVNPKVCIKEKVENPTVGSVRSCLTNIQGSSRYVAFSLDVQAAHKRVKVRHRDQGLLLFSHQNKLYTYAVCHFGGGPFPRIGGHV